jgi:hypothetical protein
MDDSSSCMLFRSEPTQPSSGDAIMDKLLREVLLSYSPDHRCKRIRCRGVVTSTSFDRCTVYEVHIGLFCADAKQLKFCQPNDRSSTSPPPIPHRSRNPSHCPSITLENVFPWKKVPGASRYVTRDGAQRRRSSNRLLTMLELQLSPCGLSTSPVRRTVDFGSAKSGNRARDGFGIDRNTSGFEELVQGMTLTRMNRSRHPLRYQLRSELHGPRSVTLYPKHRGFVEIPCSQADSE